MVSINCSYYYNVCKNIAHVPVGMHVCIQMPMNVCMCAEVRSQPDVSYSGAVHFVFIDIRSLNGLARLTGQCTPGTICF